MSIHATRHPRSFFQAQAALDLYLGQIDNSRAPNVSIPAYVLVMPIFNLSSRRLAYMHSSTSRLTESILCRKTRIQTPVPRFCFTHRARWSFRSKPCQLLMSLSQCCRSAPNEITVFPLHTGLVEYLVPCVVFQHEVDRHWPVWPNWHAPISICCIPPVFADNQARLGSRLCFSYSGLTSSAAPGLEASRRTHYPTR